MRLIDEIEAASVAWAEDSASAAEVVESPWWRRLRAALLAGEEMAEHAGHDGCDEFHEALNRFRAATEGTK